MLSIRSSNDAGTISIIQSKSHTYLLFLIYTDDRVVVVDEQAKDRKQTSTFTHEPNSTFFTLEHRSWW